MTDFDDHKPDDTPDPLPSVPHQSVDSTTHSKSPPLEEVFPYHDYEEEPLTAITSIYSMPVVSPAIPPPLPPRLPTVLHRKRAEPNDLLDKTQTSKIVVYSDDH